MFSFSMAINSFVSFFQGVCLSKIPLTSEELFVARADGGKHQPREMPDWDLVPLHCPPLR